MAENWSDAMRVFYRELDEELSDMGAMCRGCGSCCHFDLVDHVLYASALERRYLESVAPAVPVSDADTDLLRKGLRCPYQAGRLCFAREGRALGCRLYHCVWPDDVDEEAFYQLWHERLKRLHDEFGVEWEYRPLLPLA